MPVRKRVAIVIINYRTAPLVLDCLETLASEIDPAEDRVVVVDNASCDGSLQRLHTAFWERGWSEWAKLVPAERNGGFSAGNNIGFAAVDADAYLLLNSDTQLRPGALQGLLHALEQHPEAGLVSPRLEWPDGTPQESCFRYPSPASELMRAARTAPVSSLLRRFEVPLPVSDRPMNVPWTSFACVMIRREVLDTVGRMDEGYFLYFEDIDYCRRAQRAGWTILHWPRARVVHLRGGSGPVKTAHAQRTRLPRYYFESRARYFAKFYSIPGLWLTNAGWLAGRCVAFARELVGHKQPHVCEREGVDIWTSALHPLQDNARASRTTP